MVCGMVLSGKIDWQINKFCFKTDVMFVLRIVFGLDTCKRYKISGGFAFGVNTDSVKSDKEISKIQTRVFELRCLPIYYLQ